MKNGVYQEGNRFVAYVQDQVVGKGYDYRAGERAYQKATGTYVSMRGRKTTDTLMDKTTATTTEAVIPMAKAPDTPNPQSVGSYIPAKDPNFVPFGEYKEIDTIVKSQMFYPVFVTGPTGNGKSTMVEQACAKNKREYIRLQINAQTDEDQLIGSKTLVDGNIQIVEGPVLIAMRKGAILLLDELDAADPNNIMCLQSILEGRPYYFKLTNEMVYPAPGFNVFATANTKGRGSESGKYIGTKMLNEAFLERFPVTFEQEYPSMATELKIVLNAMNKFNCLDQEFADVLVKWSDAIRRTYDDGAIEDLITTRRLIQIVQGFSIFGKKDVAIRLACNRFDSLTKSTFIEVFDKLTPDNTPVKVEPVPVVDREEIPF
jgi:hypothetical protein